MNKRLFTVIVCIELIVYCLTFTTYAEYTKDESETFQRGVNLGTTFGNLYGQRDIFNHERKDPKKAFDKEKNHLYESLNQKYVDDANDFRKGIEKGFLMGYEKGYNSKLSYNEQVLSQSCANEYGKQFGGLLGKIHARIDYHQDKNSDPFRNLPKDSWIQKEYNLSLESPTYNQNFLKVFKIAYQKSYTYTFSTIHMKELYFSREKGLKYGIESGKNFGNIYGKMDNEEGRMNNWKSSVFTDEEIIVKFDLFKENSAYQKGFLVGFKDGFKESYIASFQKSNIQHIKLENLTIKGGKMVSGDDGMSIKVEPGTVYKNTPLCIEERVNLLENNEYEPVSPMYEIHIQNHAHKIMFKKPITLSFTYYGNESGGIYQWRRGKWHYLYSTIKDGKISTTLRGGIYAGGVYAVLIDENIHVCKNLHENFCSEEIYSFIRRKYIDHTFTPNAPLTFSEFLGMLKKINASKKYEWFEYKDPSTHVTYEDIERMVKKILDEDDFKWSTISEKMKREKFKRSVSRHGMHKNIPKSEVIYLLYELEADQKI